MDPVGRLEGDETDRFLHSLWITHQVCSRVTLARTPADAAEPPAP